MGGIESFVRTGCGLLDDHVVVLTRHERPALGTSTYDAELPFPVVRLSGPLLPTPRVARAARRLLRQYGITRVLIGAAAPLGLLAESLRRGGARRVVALSHGHEVWWSRVPVARRALRRIGRTVDALGYISTYTRSRIEQALVQADRAKLVHLPPPVDLVSFPMAGPSDQPVVVAAGRFVRQKGFDRLLAAWPRILAGCGQARLVIVGSGREAVRLRREAADLESVTVLPPVPHEAMARVLAQARVFLLPVRTRVGGLYAEGLGLSFLEAAATGLPVVVGRSGGAPETVIDGVSGRVVDPEDPAEIAAATLPYLHHLELARAAGVAGRALVEHTFSAQVIARRLRAALDLPPPGAHLIELS